MDEISDTADDKSYIRPQSPRQSIQNSPRDDGYHSKAGESSTAEEAYSTDTQSVATEETMQVVVIFFVCINLQVWINKLHTVTYYKKY